MDYIGKILKGVCDNKKLHEYPQDSALRILVDAYVKESVRNAALPAIDLQSTGGEFKLAFSRMEAAEKVTLMYNYLVNIAADSPLAEILTKADEKEDRHFRRWLIKSAVYLLGSLVFLIVGATIAIGVKTGVVSDNPAFASIVNTAMEILKLIFTSVV